MITLENCAKVYGKGESAVRALAGVTLRVARGESVAVRGPSIDKHEFFRQQRVAQ